MQEKQIKTENGQLHYWIGGRRDEDARCILFVHGMLVDHSIFSEQLSFFSENYTVIAVDAPLHGKSRDYENFTFDRAADQLKQILDREGIRKAILVGQSMGGYICQVFGVRFPGRVEAFIGVGTHPFGKRYYKKWERYAMTRLASLVSILPYKLLIPFLSRNVNTSAEAYDKTVQLVSRFPKQRLIRIIRHVIRLFFKQEETGTFSFPVLLIAGEKEITGFIKKYNLAWAKREGYSISIISGAAHNTNMDRADEFNAVVEAFLKW